MMNLMPYRFTRSQRLKDQTTFVRATRTGTRDVRGPLIFHALPATRDMPRFGIRIGRRCGTAPTRNRIKRLLREAYRLMQHDWPVAIDLVVTVKPHEPMSLADYQKALSAAQVRLCRKLMP